ncbi:unnamed protein product [Moneuplotes crassus]|uniref:Uncharacterized protein n=1 Tax=Euplotes crassus TaxID=5936 RepID=A0AAD1U967_EUPCR|nr:unnamed protein product [Moneuplotes crassus]
MGVLSKRMQIPTLNETFLRDFHDKEKFPQRISKKKGFEMSLYEGIQPNSTIRKSSPYGHLYPTMSIYKPVQKQYQSYDTQQRKSLERRTIELSDGKVVINNSSSVMDIKQAMPKKKGRKAHSNLPKIKGIDCGNKALNHFDTKILKQTHKKRLKNRSEVMKKIVDAKKIKYRKRNNASSKQHMYSKAKIYFKSPNEKKPSSELDYLNIFTFENANKSPKLKFLKLEKYPQVAGFGLNKTSSTKNKINEMMSKIVKRNKGITNNSYGSSMHSKKKKGKLMTPKIDNSSAYSSYSEIPNVPKSRPAVPDMMSPKIFINNSMNEDDCDDTEYQELQCEYTSLQKEGHDVSINALISSNEVSEKVKITPCSKKKKPKKYINVSIKL